MATVGENIKRVRIAAGIKTQGEMAKRLGVPQPQLSDWENDRYGTPDMKTLLRIAAAIPCALDALVQGLDPQYDKGRDLPDHASQVQTDSHLLQGESVGPAASTRMELDSLRTRVQDYETLIAEMQGITSKLFRLAALGEEGSAARRAQPKGRRAVRKTG